MRKRIAFSPGLDRLLTGIGSASVVVVGANFAGITSFLLGFSPGNFRSLKLDVLYPIGGYSRCIESTQLEVTARCIEGGGDGVGRFAEALVEITGWNGFSICV